MPRPVTSNDSAVSLHAHTCPHGLRPLNLREVENSLLVLLGFESVDIIKLVLSYCIRILGVVSLERARNDAERDAVEAVLNKDKMREGR